MAVNVKGSFLGMRAALPPLGANGGGAIINMVSVASWVVLPGMAPYCASKGAVLQLTRTAAVEYAEEPVFTADWRPTPCPSRPCWPGTLDVIPTGSRRCPRWSTAPRPTTGTRSHGTFEDLGWDEPSVETVFGQHE